MSPRARFWLWALALYAAALGVVGAFALLAGAGLPEAQAGALARALEMRAAALVFLAVLLFFACAGAVRWFFAEHVAPVQRLAEQTRLIRSANAELRLAPDAAGALGPVAAAINELAGAYCSLQQESEGRAAEARASLEEERNRLAALMSELAQGVIVCNGEGIILLYNEAARVLFAPAGTAATAPPVGLGRSIFALIERSQIAHAVHKLERSLERDEPLPGARFVATLPAGRLVRCHVAPVLGAARALAGMVITFEDVTGVLDRESQRRSLLQAFAGRIRAPAANIRAAAETLASFPEMESARREQFVGIVAAEAAALSGTINEAMREHADALKAALQLEDLRATDLLEFARVRIAATLPVSVELDESGEDLWLRADSYALVQAMVHLAARVHEAHGVRRFDLRARPAGRHGEIDIAWAGAIVGSDALSLWEAQPLEAGAEQSALTVRDILEQHGGEAWYQSSGVGGLRSACFRLLIPAGEPATAGAARLARSRPEYYDFDLFGAGELGGAMHEAGLATLRYTAFDTETTGLQPSAGDEIISIGAVRIVNGRLLRNEIYEQLVNPGRPLNRASAQVHGIEARALSGQPPIGEVLPAFHRFCEDTVLVAHNAAFDMRFLELKRAATGVHFAQPVLDTLLLSALLHPSLQDHRLEAIAERLGVDPIGRHTALGDAMLTGEIFLKLLPLLAERGLTTLAEALAASRETYYVRLQY